MGAAETPGQWSVVSGHGVELCSGASGAIRAMEALDEGTVSVSCAFKLYKKVCSSNLYSVLKSIYLYV